LVLAGLALRLVPLFRDPFHQDEVLYAFWGRLINSGRDPWLTSVPVDKPPLMPYLIAASQAAFGGSALAVRLAGLAASLLTIPLTFSLASRLYASRTAGWVAAAVMALTPYAVLFGATAFTDPILVLWWLGACWAALSGRWGWAGIMLGLAFATKQQAIALAPLVLGSGLVGWQWEPVGISPGPSTAGRSPGDWRSFWAKMGRFFLAFIGVLALVAAWDNLRLLQGGTAGFWDQSVDSYGGLRLIWPSELQPRLQGWARHGSYLFGWSWLGVLFLVSTVLLVWSDLTRARQTRAAFADLVLITFACIFLFFHWVVAFPVWDRYLLPVLPVAALLSGRMVIRFRERWQGGTRRTQGFALVLCALLLLPVLVGGVVAADGRIPVGGDHGAYDGLNDVIGFLYTLPVGTVVYDRWLSWHYDYYLFDAYLYRAGFPTPEWLAADAAALYDGRPRYVVIPNWESPVRLARALAAVDLSMSSVLTVQRRGGEISFTIYEIAPKERK
jgi:hypothetical protein